MSISTSCGYFTRPLTDPCGHKLNPNKIEPPQPKKCCKCGKNITTGTHCSYDCQIRDDGFKGSL